MKPKLNLPAFLAGFCFFTLWNVIGPPVSRTAFLLLDAPHVFPRAVIYWIISLLPFIVFLEVLVKLLLMNALPSKLAYQAADLEAVSGLDGDALATYTTNLESLGFTKLTDFQLLEASRGFARLFSHPNHRCFVEVFQLVGRTEMCCGINSLLDQGWAVGTTDRPLNGLSATWYAFLRLPHNLCVGEPGATLNHLLQSHLELRQRLMADLQLQVIPDTSAQTYFDSLQRTRTKQKRQLWRKSILLCLVEMLMFSINPKTEWLGEYVGLAAQRRRN